MNPRTIPIAVSIASALAAQVPAQEAPGLPVEVSLSPTGHPTLTFPASEQDYYRLLRLDDPFGSPRVVSLALGEDGPLSLRDPLPAFGQTFYQIETVPNSNPLDSDADGRSDVEELQGLPDYNPLNAGRALTLSRGAAYIPDRATYETLARRENVPGAINIREVKFVVMDAHTDQPKLSFINTNRYEFHYTFASGVLGYRGTNGQFNNETYFNDSRRRNLAGSFLSHENYELGDGRKGIYTMEFWPTDPVGFEFVHKAYQLLASALPFIETRLVYHPNGQTQRTKFEQERHLYEDAYIHTITTEELFANVSYTALNEEFSYGRLRLAEIGDTLNIRDIAIFDTVPNELSHISGIITTIPQTPLSHINLIAKQNDTPNAYIKDASTHPDIAPLIGKDVRYEVTADGFLITPATKEEVDAFFESIRPSEPQTPDRDLSVTSAASLDDIGFRNADAYGSKAANVGELKNIRNTTMTVPGGFAFPFYFYDEFMKFNGFYDDATVMMSTSRFQTDPAFREARLDLFRDTLEDGDAPQWMLDAVLAVQQSFPADTRIRCRSSTNNEDLVGFNGAGLYESKTHKPSEGHLINTLKQVWAGLWTFRAWEEREFYRIDHHVAAMGILLHPSYQNEQSNGVAVTKNIFDPDWTRPGHYVNVQPGDSLVTNPDAAAVPEEFLIADLLGQTTWEIQYARFSNLVPEGETVLSVPEAERLAANLTLVKNHFARLYRKTNDPDFAMEVEFKFTSDGNLAIKQARPWVD